MGKRDKRLKELARAKKRHQSRPKSAWLETGKKSSAKLLKEMSQNHQDVLQNIEAVLVLNFRKDERVDDVVVFAVLAASLGKAIPDDDDSDLVSDMVDELSAVRQLRSDVDDAVWRDCLRVVQDSVKTHSSLRRGETSYLEFASDFMPEYRRHDP